MTQHFLGKVLFIQLGGFLEPPVCSRSWLSLPFKPFPTFVVVVESTEFQKPEFQGKQELHQF